MNTTAPTSSHPWIWSLQDGLDGLETALLAGDASAVERASLAVQRVLQGAPKTAEFASPGRLRADMADAAQRFGQLRQAVLRAGAQSQRAVHSLLPQQKQATYGGLTRATSTGGAGRAYLSA